MTYDTVCQKRERFIVANVVQLPSMIQNKIQQNTLIGLPQVDQSVIGSNIFFGGGMEN